MGAAVEEEGVGVGLGLAAGTVGDCGVACASAAFLSG